MIVMQRSVRDGRVSGIRDSTSDHVPLARVIRCEWHMLLEHRRGMTLHGLRVGDRKFASLR